MNDLVKLAFELKPGLYEGVELPFNAETLWSRSVGTGLYELDNIPLYAKGVSFKDVVRAERDESGMLIYRGVAARSGHSTFRVIFKDGEDNAKTGEGLLDFLKTSSFAIERTGRGVIAIDVPPMPDEDLLLAKNLLYAAQDDGVWSVDVGYDATDPT